jgi:Tfp pilus assembly PilM family ATPase
MLGIGFSGNNISFTEIVMESGLPKLTHVETLKVNFNFEDDFARYKSSQKDLTNISSEIQDYLTKRNLNVTSAALSIGTSQAFLVTLPVDYSEGKQSIDSKIYWELSNFFPDNYNEYVINTYRMNNVLPNKDSDDFLIIAVHKNSLEFIKRTFKMCGLNISMIDVDHFSAEHSLRKSYEQKLEGKNILLIGLKKGRIDYGYIQNKKYKFYAYSKYNSDTEFNLSLTRKINSLMQKEPLSQGVDSIFLYGDDIREDTLEALRKLDKAPVEVINPFVNVKATDIFLKNEDLRKISYKYASSCGVALRSAAAPKAPVKSAESEQAE